MVETTPELPLANLAHLNLQARHLDLLCELLRRHLPHAEVWAYGSRVNGDGHEASDLDLAIRQPADLDRPTAELNDLRAALTESTLPIRVDAVDWARIPRSFQCEIEHRFVVVQPAQKVGADGTAEKNA
ncbi:MAG TPA: nucleotidyltransferase domain-containing protein [Rhodocyclaceae bacterium]|nr:nucleotidyltransferase domain-containing protein [Rhodocyclaceae bacterium]